jgi:WD40 repeat protein
MLTHGSAIECIAFHPEESRLASGACDRVIKIWDLDVMREVTSFHEHVGTVSALAFDPTGHRLASASGGMEGTDNVVRLWEDTFDPDLLARRIMARQEKRVAQQAASDLGN